VDYINFEVSGRKKIISKVGQSIACNSKLFRLYQDRSGAAGYILWPSGAKKLLRYERENGIAIADAQIAHCNTLVGYQLEPGHIIQLGQCKNFDIPNIYSDEIQISTVSQPNNPKGSPIFWIKRIKAQVKIGVHILSLIAKSKRRYIKINKENFYTK